MRINEPHGAILLTYSWGGTRIDVAKRPRIDGEAQVEGMKRPLIGSETRTEDGARE